MFIDIWVKVNGNTYKNMSIAMHINDNSVIFDEIRFIMNNHMIINNMRQISFICTEFHTEAINSYYFAFKIIKKPI